MPIRGSLPFSDLNPTEIEQSDRFDVWRESISPLFDSDSNLENNEFDASARLFLSKDCIISNTSFNSQRFIRNSRWCNIHDPDHILIQLYTEGGYVGHNGSKKMEIRAGDIALLDLGYVLSTNADHSSVISMILPRRAVIDYCGPEGLKHGFIIPREAPVAKLMGGQIRLLWDQIHGLEAAVAEIAIEKIAHTFMDFFKTLQQGNNSIESVDNSEILNSCKVYIENNLNHSQLNADTLCRYFGLSRSSIYRLFQPEGGINSYIQRRRLYRCYKDIARRNYDTIGDLADAWGFKDQSYFTRLFKKEFNIKPSELVESSSLITTPTSSTELDDHAVPEYQKWLARL